MANKSFFEDGQQLVLESLQGFTKISPELIFNKATKTVHYAHHDGNKTVTLISGGGAGHEPAHAALVGHNLLSAAVSGNIFASPSVSQILSAIKNISGSAGTILIIKNYTGDVFHFHLAAEKARAQFGLRVEVLVVGDDVAVGRKKSGKVGRRGLAGTVLVHKVLGALAAQGKGIDELLKVGRKVVDGLVTCGVSQGHVHIPGTKAQEGEEAQLELGMGIHNEPGCYVLNPRPKLDELLRKILDLLLLSDDTDRAYVSFEGENPILLVNNLGGISQLEQSALVHRAVALLESRGVSPCRVLSGTLMTSLDASGFSLTLLKTTPDILAAVDAPTTAVGWPQVYSSYQGHDQEQVIEPKQETAKQVPSDLPGPKLDVPAFTAAVEAACKSVLKAEPQITENDRIVGDGDCGATLSRGANAISEAISGLSSSATASSAVMRIANAIEHNMDGTSGAVYELFFTALTSALQSLKDENATVEVWAKAATIALERLEAMTPARVGDRTLMNALIPFIQTLSQSKTLSKAVDAAREGRDSTKGMTASLGRAVYVAEGNWDKVPDPGAEGVVAIVEGFLQSSS